MAPGAWRALFSPEARVTDLSFRGITILGHHSARAPHTPNPGCACRTGDLRKHMRICSLPPTCRPLQPRFLSILSLGVCRKTCGLLARRPGVLATAQQAASTFSLPPQGLYWPIQTLTFHSMTLSSEAFMQARGIFHANFLSLSPLPFLPASQPTSCFPASLLPPRFLLRGSRSFPP